MDEEASISFERGHLSYLPPLLSDRGNTKPPVVNTLQEKENGSLPPPPHRAFTQQTTPESRAEQNNILSPRMLKDGRVLSPGVLRQG